MKYNYKQIEKILKINFNNKKLLIKSLVHKSFDKNENNEKLEFLGDRVVGLVISEKLLALYPDEKEGIIDKKFANLVNKKTCAKIAHQLNLKKFIKTAKSYKNLKSSDEKILSDGCEALIGAIYLDQGFAISEKFILRNWNNFIKRSNIIEVDSKTKLQEYSLKKYKKLPLYTTFKQTGAKHNPTFKIHVQIPKSKKYTGYGKSKKIAQQDAASQLIKNLNIN
jgi:ribonuclease-3